MPTRHPFNEGDATRVLEALSNKPELEIGVRRGLNQKCWGGHE